MMEEQGANRLEVAGYGDKRMITVTFAATLSRGKFLSMQILHGGKTDRCHPQLSLISSQLKLLGK